MFQKMLELDPENAALQSKLAELYMKLGKKEDAKNIFLRAAESQYQRGVKDAATESLNKVLNIEGGNVRALQLRAQLALDRGDAAQAVQAFEKIPDLDSRPDALKSLLQAYVQLGKVEQVAPCAKKLLSVHHDISGMKLYADTLLATGKLNQAIGVYQEFADQLISANGPATVRALDAYISKVKDDPKALEDLNVLFQKAGDTSHAAEIMELLAHACVQQGDLMRARDLYKELAEMEPENPLHHQNYKQIQARLGEDSTVRELSTEEGSQALMVEELETQEVLVEQRYPDLVASAIQAALTESDLFESYNVPHKALTPLEVVLPQAPQDVRLNQRLAALYARLGRNAEAAQRCAVLQKVFSGSGFHEEAIRYGEMAAKYAQAGGTAVPTVASFTPEQINPVAGTSQPGPTFSIEPEASAGKVEEFYFQQAPAAPPSAPPPMYVDVSPAATEPEPAAHAHEIDLSDEWESMLEVEAPTPAAEASASNPVVTEPEPTPQPEPVAQPAEEPMPDTAVADTVEEVRFYISQSMWSEAASAVDKLASLAPGLPEAEQFRRQILAAMVLESPKEEADAPTVTPEEPAAPEPTYYEAAAAADAEPSITEFSFERAPEVAAAPALEPTAAEPVAEVQDAIQEVAESAPLEILHERGGDVLDDFVNDLEAALGDDFLLGGDKPAAQPSMPPPLAEPVMSAAAFSPATEIAPAFNVPPAAQPALAAVATAPAFAERGSAEAGASLLQDLFDEFKEDLEEGSGQTEDPETHYNLGVAFKEMGLLDEAIGELQKVCQAIDRGQPFSQSMQAFTWLANCFVEKGVPEASFKWYQKALSAADNDETRTAIHYELARAYEAAGMKPEAVRHFMEVYSANIDYRDVAERIKHLKS
jgi:tetratricopeptide (TPR) repeat protein